MADNTRKQADKILKSEQLENRTTNVLIFGIDADGRVNEWNQTAERITHYSKDEVMDRDLVKNFITDEYKESVKQVLDKALTGEQTDNYEFPLFTKGGERVDVLLNSTTRRDAEGRIVGVVGVGQDITELNKVRLEQARVADDLRDANVELVRANRLKDEFLANMSHELRTPLTSIIEMMESLTEGIYGPVNERQKKSLKIVENSGMHLLDLINDILDLSKINAGRIQLQIGQVSVEALCQGSLKMVKEMARKKDQDVSVSISEGLDNIRVDPRRTKQILVNLLINAVKFTPEGGEILLEAKNIHASQAVSLTVRDTGIGISKENLKSIFKPFIQVDGSLSREQEGTGLGLALVYQLAELHGGSVNIESEFGEYTSVTVVLPMGRGFQKNQDRDSYMNGSLDAVDPLNAIANAKILLADDHKSSVILISDYLKTKFSDVIEASDGLEAVKLTSKEKPDLILMDVQMPRMDGLEAIRQIRDRENRQAGTAVRKIPIIALTALAMPGDRESCLNAGADEYMSKPVNLKALTKIIQQMLKK